MQSHGFQCNLYVNNVVIYIFILNLPLKLQLHKANCLLIYL